MNIIVGVRESSRELHLELDLTADELTTKVAQALTGDSFLDLTDTEGARYLVPGHALTFVQIADEPKRRVGFMI